MRAGAAPPGGPSGGLLGAFCVVDDTFVPGLKFRGEVRNVGPNPAGTGREAFSLSVHKVKANPILGGVKINPVSTFYAPILVFRFKDRGFDPVGALAAGGLRVAGGALGLVSVQQKATLAHLSRFFERCIAKRLQTVASADIFK